MKGTHCDIKQCADEPLYHATSASAYDVYLYMDDFLIDLEFNTNVQDNKPVVMHVITKGDLVNVHASYPSQNSATGSISSATF
eukprot:Awhi_evm1s13492